MGAATASFPRDWLEHKSHPAGQRPRPGRCCWSTATDLLEDPPDRLADLVWLTGALTRVGHRDVAASLTGSETSRDFDCCAACSAPPPRAPDLTSTAAAALNPQLVRRLGPSSCSTSIRTDGHPTLQVGVGLRGVAALEARLPAALAAYVAEHGTSRLGVCGSDPCRCVVRRPHAGRHAQVLLHLLQRPVRRPRLPAPQALLTPPCRTHSQLRHRVEGVDLHLHVETTAADPNSAGSVADGVDSALDDLRVGLATTSGSLPS